MKKRIGLAVVGVIIFLIMCILGATVNSSYGTRRLNGNTNENIKKSIANFHKEYVNGSKSVNIIDVFNYDVNKVVMFNYEESIGYAKFTKDHQGDFKIIFVETYNKNDEREISK